MIVLSYLKIENIAIIDHLQVNFSLGLNMLTGETGAGKSIIIDALGLILGERSDPQLIRAGSQKGTVEGIFNIEANQQVKDKLAKLHIEHDGKEIHLRRVMTSEGKSRAFVNNTLISLKNLKEIGENLVAIHGQHTHQELLHRENHTDYLDYFGNNYPARRRLQSTLHNIKELTRQLEGLKMDEREKSQKIDLLTFQIDEISRTNLQPHEDEELEKKKTLLGNAERIHELASHSYSLLYEEENSVISIIDQIKKRLLELTHIDDSYSPHLTNLEEIKYKLEDLSLFLRDYLQSVKVDPQQLQEVEDRLVEIRRLKKKYGDTIEDILNFKKSAQTELKSISVNEEKIEELTNQLEEEYSRYYQAAEELSTKRKEDAKQLKHLVEKELSQLAMEKTQFEASFQPVLPGPGSIKIGKREVWGNERGIDQVEFFIAPNIGEELRPLAKIASGGEISRLMLALKSTINTAETFKTLIFDEIDLGIGGRVAEVVGRKLSLLSSVHQIICITHLPQIAAFAQQHYFVEKRVHRRRTRALIRELNKDELIEEIARMLGGETITETTRRHAREMIESCSSSTC
ncbi:DNA repair protein RecN [bacterium (candidate division B38) B3_B38]|nr:MAG: DNA repair protein RecN [bacterium (candidate division B38) B3_B38]